MFKNILSAALLGLSANARPDECWHVPKEFEDKTTFDGVPYIDFKWTRKNNWSDENSKLNRCMNKCDYIVVQDKAEAVCEFEGNRPERDYLEGSYYL